jgi:hypothetical protein
MNRLLLAVLAAILASSALPARAQDQGAPAPQAAPVSAQGAVTFQMDRLDSVRAFWARYYGAPLAYGETGEEDLQDSIARCVLSFLRYKMKRLDTVILYAGRDPGDAEHLICHVFPLDRIAYEHMCAKLGLRFLAADEARYRLTCAEPQADLTSWAEPPR